MKGSSGFCYRQGLMKGLRKNALPGGIMGRAVMNTNTELGRCLTYYNQQDGYVPFSQSG